MITLAQYVGAWFESPDWTPKRQANAVNLLLCVNALIADLEAAGIKCRINPATKSQVSGTTYGGFRPQSCLQGAQHSNHKEGLAVDIYDPLNEIDNYLNDHQDLMVKHGIYIEAPSSTIHWCHCQTKKPLSGHRIFNP